MTVHAHAHDCTSKWIRLGSATNSMKSCLTNTIGLIANASVDSMQLMGYNETVTYIDDAIVYEYCIRSSISICESVEGQAHRALEASIQEETFDEVLSQCLGRAVTGVSGIFTSTRSALPAQGAPLVSSTLMESTDVPVTSPTPQPARATNNGKNYSGTAQSCRINE